VDDLLLKVRVTQFLPASLVRDAGAQLTVAHCYAAYVEFCNERGWRALAETDLAQSGDTVDHQFRITPRHDISESEGKARHSAAGKGLPAMKFSGKDWKVSKVARTAGHPFPTRL
jgi:hypothetical protein